MKLIKKVSATPVQENTGAIIDSLNTTDNPHTNAPSINAIKTYVDNEINDVNTDLAQCVVKGDIAVIDTDITLAANTGDKAVDGICTYTEKVIDYPTGFNKNNCVLISIGAMGGNGRGYGWREQATSLDLYQGTLPITVGLYADDGTNYDNKIRINAGNLSTHAQTYHYKLVLMKVS